MHKKKIEKKELRSFGLIWSAIFLGLALYPLVKHRSLDLAALLQKELHVQIYAGAFAAFLLISIIYPFALSAFYKIWIKIGDIIGGIISKVILILMFYLLFAPVGLILRLLRKDLLNKRLDKTTKSYWKARTQQPQSLKNQF